MDNRNSANLNLSDTLAANLSADDFLTSARASRLESISFRPILDDVFRARCPNCKSIIIVAHSDPKIQFDLDWKRHCCTHEDRRVREEKWVEKIESIVDYGNRHELSAFRLRLVMDD